MKRRRLFMKARSRPVQVPLLVTTAAATSPIYIRLIYSKAAAEHIRSNFGFNLKARRGISQRAFRLSCPIMAVGLGWGMANHGNHLDSDLYHANRGSALDDDCYLIAEGS